MPIDCRGDGRALDQRGGIHSDPLVRLLAFRAWGERERAWRKRDTAKAAALNGHVGQSVETWKRVYGLDHFFVTPDRDSIVYHATRGSLKASVERTSREQEEAGGDFFFDLFDEIDSRLRARPGSSDTLHR